MRISSIFIGAALMMMAGCSDGRKTECGLLPEIMEIVNNVPGCVGVAFVSDNDTVLVNNGVRFPMMSVFKLHQALAVWATLERGGVILDSRINVAANELDTATWSPMMRQYFGRDFEIPVSELVEYSLTASDNNASNLLFSHVASPEETDRYVKSVAADTTFSIRYSEAEMKANHELSYENRTSPLAAALLIRQVFRSDILSEEVYCEGIRKALCAVTTGQDRLGAPFVGMEDVVFAHKTGSGYCNGRGELAAFNDVAYVRLPDGRDYGLAVLIRDFSGTESEASAVMSEISCAVLAHLPE